MLEKDRERLYLTIRVALTMKKKIAIVIGLILTVSCPRTTSETSGEKHESDQTSLARRVTDVVYCGPRNLELGQGLMDSVIRSVVALHASHTRSGRIPSLLAHSFKGVELPFSRAFNHHSGSSSHHIFLHIFLFPKKKYYDDAINEKIFYKNRGLI